MKRTSYPTVRRVTLSSKGQMTVPVAIRRRHGLKPGDKVAIALEAEDGFRATILPNRRASS